MGAAQPAASITVASAGIHVDWPIRRAVGGAVSWRLRDIGGVMMVVAGSRQQLATIMPTAAVTHERRSGAH
jgi:hypothetical protein